MKIDYKKLILALLIPQIIGIVSGIFTRNSIQDWYGTLVKPAINPPDYVFSIVWTFLFLLMGVSLYLLWMSKKNKKALNWFYTQLGLNFLWSILFFGFRNPLLAFIEIFVLEFTILITIIKSYKVSKLSAYLLIPYLLWVGFAIILNYFILKLNL